MPHRLAQHNSHHMTIFEGPGQARLCLQCRNQAENFPCPVKVEEDDEQPQENYRLIPHLTLGLTIRATTLKVKENQTELKLREVT